MADENFGIIVQIDPRPAVAGSAQVDAALERNEASARELERTTREAMQGVAAAAREAARAQEKAARDAARSATTAVRQAAKDQDETARAMTIAAERRAKERAQIEVEAARKAAAAQKQAADQQRQAQAGLAQAYRQIVGPAAEYQQRLAQIIQLERQGAITARQRAQAIDGMNREIKLHNAKQAGGVGGAVSGAMASQFGAVAGPAAGVALAITAGRELIQLGDAYTTLSNKIRTSTTSEAEMIRMREKLFASADKARVDVNLLTGVYAQMRIATKDLGTSQGELLRVSELLAKATRGVGEANKSAGLQQFGQALTKGKLQAEELMSIMENIPKVGVLLAQGMGMTVGELRKAAEAGKVGTQQMLDAIQRVGPEIEREFGLSAQTSAESWTALKNQVLQTVGGFAEQVNVSGAVAKVVGEIGSGLKIVGDLLSQNVAVWKSIDGVTGGVLSKIAAQPGILTQINNLAGRVATQTFVGFEASQAFTEEIKRSTTAIEARTVALEGELALLSNPMFTSSSKDRDGLVTGYGLLGNFARQSANVDEAKTFLRMQKDKAAAAAEGVKAHRAMEAAGKQFADGLRAAYADAGTTIDSLGERFATLGNGVEAFIDRAQELDQFKIEVIDLTTTIGAEFTDAAAVVTGFFAVSEEASKNAVDSMGEIGTTLGEQFGGALKQTTDALIEWAAGTEVSFRDMARSILIELAKVMAQMLLVQGIKAAFGSSPGGFGASLLSSFGGFAAGGSFTVPGGGGTDSVPVAFRATPGERVTISTPGQAQASDGARVAPVNVRAILVHDPAEAAIAALHTPAGERAIIAAISANPGAIAAALGRR